VWASLFYYIAGGVIIISSGVPTCSIAIRLWNGVICDRTVVVLSVCDAHDVVRLFVKDCEVPLKVTPMIDSRIEFSEVDNGCLRV
jgi:hypothetical protein